LVGDCGVFVGRERDYGDFVECGAGDGDVDPGVGVGDGLPVVGGHEPDRHLGEGAVGDELADVPAELGVGDAGVDHEAAVFLAGVGYDADDVAVLGEELDTALPRDEGAGLDGFHEAREYLGGCVQGDGPCGYLPAAAGPGVGETAGEGGVTPPDPVQGR
jgi:hypothetical protein